MQTIHKDLREMHLVGERSREWRLAADACPGMADAGILYAGWTQARSGYRFVRHHAPFRGLLACDGGRGRVLVRGVWQPCLAGQAYLLPEGKLHAYRAAGRWDVLWIAFASAEALPSFGDSPQIVMADPRPLRAALTGLQREINGPAEVAALRHWLSLIRLYGLRIAGGQGANSTEPQDRLFRLWEHVDANLERPWSLTQLAEVAGMSGEHLRRLCQRQMASSPVAQLTKLRMRRAAALLDSGGAKVATIARLVGYANPFAFSSSFRRHFGLSPASYRLRRLTAWNAGSARDREVES